MKTCVILIAFTLLNFSLFAQIEVSQKTLSQVEVLQNETSDILFLRNSEAAETYRIIDMNGKVVQQGYTNAQIITILELEPGFYLLELRNAIETRNIRIRKR